MEVITSTIETFINNNFATYLTPLATDTVPLPLPEVVIDEPDLMRYSYDNVLFLMPDQGEVEFETIGSDEHTVTIDVIIFTKGLTPENLYYRAMRYLRAFYKMVKSNPLITNAQWAMRDYEYFSGGDGTGSNKGIRIGLIAQYQESV
jgi:hypothetical protein